MALELRRYVDLRLSDLTAQALVDTARTTYDVKLPGLVWREGVPQAVLIEAQAQQNEELAYLVNRLPGVIAEVQARLFGLERDAGAVPVATVQFNLADAGDHVLPAGTQVRLVVAGLEPITFTTTADSVQVGAVATAPAAGDRFTAEANGTPAATALEVVTAAAYVNSAELDTAVADGVDPETEVAWLDRAVRRFGRLSETLVDPAQFELAAGEIPGVGIARALNNYDPAVGGAPGDSPGHITVAVADVAGAALSVPAMAALEAAMDDQAASWAEVHVVAPDVTAVALDVTVERLAGYGDAEVAANVAAAARAYVDPAAHAARGWPPFVYRLDLIAELDRAAGVGRVVAMAAPAADVALAGVAPLVDLTEPPVVTVVAPA